MSRYQTRIHEAPAVPCPRCGSALPVDPTAAHVWCPFCFVWNPVPNALQRRAHEYLHATEKARQEQAAYAALAEHQWREAHTQRRQATNWKWVIGFFLLMSLPGLALSVLIPLWQWVVGLSDEYELWALALIVVALGITTLLVTIGFVAAAYGVYRLLTRHKRRTKERADSEWFQAGAGASAGALCGVCGGPLAFRVGESAVTCGFCRNVVVATSRHKHKLIQLALRETQLALLQHAEAERQTLLAQLQNQRGRTAYMAYAFVGSLLCAALPVAAAFYAWRTLTPSLEQALLDLADELSGEFSAGLEPAFEWLDSYWLAQTPARLRLAAPFQSRWNIEAVFHERPVLITATTSWSDRVARNVSVLLARPVDRSPSTISRAMASPSAHTVQSLGFTISLDYAGVCLDAFNVRQRELTRDRLTRLAQAAYELAEYREQHGG
jgi:uncharacterized CHY-type Zn-finger protein